MIVYGCLCVLHPCTVVDGIETNLTLGSKDLGRRIETLYPARIPVGSKERVFFLPDLWVLDIIFTCAILHKG